ncbi:hypothetical protein KQX54_020196 [Cotesia glomerata]|uniref:Uncharacterized protein n=1 Tax=Cotesia glomerata TaxID=32391 RepID=A0AAV7ISF8_COTGL|nr:hypothetical protein KQX54_020196 [Cotesia glomerata]
MLSFLHTKPPQELHNNPLMKAQRHDLGVMWHIDKIKIGFAESQLDTKSAIKFLDKCKNHFKANYLMLITCEMIFDGMVSLPRRLVTPSWSSLDVH